ncbi:MAG: CDP-diacylglycerol--glycerol-3-phosphate 3-phosphatidyltransferase [Candidatus Nanopelagicales bacterium]|jgi:cardiolipin synthase|nr:CDP-diacylglycerol--glycerol-3-phosphate 3-phosphatidyltransferase [Candidatus Nanopelagicales bacterium]
MQVQQTAVQTDRVLTLPNALSVLRLVSIPVFIWLALVPEADGAAALVLVVGGLTDYFDGMLARRWNQISRVGQLLDPIADRLATLAVLIVFLVRDVVPWWFVVVLLGRDLVLALQMAVLKRHGVTGLPVNFVGKAATFHLMASFPLLMWGVSATSGPAEVARIVGWALALWGAFLYLYAGWLYLRQARQVIAATPIPAGG